jgi:hypothetical protein
MIKPWLTVSVIIFGIIVAIVGVVAYLRMYKSSMWYVPQSDRNKPAAPTEYKTSEQTKPEENSTDYDIK